MKIFISIASYQDPLLEATINSAFTMSDKPENLIFGICDQSSVPFDKNSFEFKNQAKNKYGTVLDVDRRCGTRLRFSGSARWLL